MGVGVSALTNKLDNADEEGKQEGDLEGTIKKIKITESPED